MTEKANSQLIRTINERRLLNLIRERGPISRNQLAVISKISKVAVSSIINRLDNNGFILEIGKGKSSNKGGRRPTLLKLNPDNKYVVGIQIKHAQISIALANIEFEIKGFIQLKYDIDASMDHVIFHIFNELDKLLEKNKIPKEKLASIVIGMPGLINYKKGSLSFAVTLKEWKNFPIAPRFSSWYNVPTLLENDVNTVTMSESLIGAGRGFKNMVCILIESGIGLGIISNGQLVRGETGHSGEIGYLEVGNYIANYDRIKNLYHGQRFFGELLSEVNLCNTFIKKNMIDPIDLKDKSSQPILKEILLSGDNGNLVVQEVLDELAYLLALVCLNLIKSINPGLIIISGFIIENSKFLFDKIIGIIEQSMRGVPVKPSKIVVGELKEKAGVEGAIAMALQTIFDQSAVKSRI